MGLFTKRKNALVAKKIIDTMTQREEFTNAGFTLVSTEDTDLPQFNSLRDLQDYIRNNNLDDLENLQNHGNPQITKIIVQTLLTLPFDEKVNGYGLNFVGRNFAKAKYAQKTEKELKLNSSLSKDIDTTQNLVLKGDNLDSLKILKNYYTNKIKCIYIDPPYNTTSDEFVYPDKFDKEETEVLGLANLSEDDFARMDFSFKTKKSHNGWLAFMYPRLLLARDLLSKDGVIFISIDDNEQANLKLLCDEIFGEENFVNQFIWEKKKVVQNDAKFTSTNHEYILAYRKTEQRETFNLLERTEEANARYSNPDNDHRGNWTSVALTAKSGSSIYEYTFDNGVYWKPTEGTYPRLSKDSLIKAYEDNRLWFGKDGKNVPRLKKFLSEVKQGIVANSLVFNDNVGSTQLAKEQIKRLLNANTFDTPKPIDLIRFLAKLVTDKNSIILDFFAGSGTTGHAVMQLNAEDGGNRKFILCQIDEPIDKKKEAYKFCIENGLEPVISSITIERLRRAGEKIKNSLNRDLPDSNDLFADIQGNQNNPKNEGSDIGFKVFDSVNAPKLDVQDGQIIFPKINDDALSRIYNMIFTVGLDEPTQVPETVVENCIYKIGRHYYITNSNKVNSDDFAKVIKNGKVFIDGWTATINTTLQQFKEDVKLVF